MPNQADQSTLNMSKIGPAIASILILLIVIGYSIKTIKNQVRYIRPLAKVVIASSSGLPVQRLSVLAQT
ncbi:MAG: hypothetical protein L0G58_12615 [Acinetobacter sp.]|nr:hypothetical protein [Acinetobacter sp.]